MEPSPTTASILLVGSHEKSLPRLCRELREAGYATVGCVDPEQAAVLIDHHPIDALVLDAAAGRRSGHTLAEHLRRAHPLSYVILARHASDVMPAVRHVFTSNEN